MKLRYKLSYILGFILILFLFSCDTSLTGDVNVTEVKRFLSPDHKVEVVLAETDGGATTSTSCKVFIVKPGKKVTVDDFNYAVFNCDHFSGINIDWKENKTLRISYKSARIFNYSKIWKDKDAGGYFVNVKLNKLP